MKYIVDIPEQIAELSADYMKKVGMSIEPYTEPSYKAMELQHSNDILKVSMMNYYKGAEDGWNLAREIAYCMSLQECEDAGMVDEDDIYNDASGVLEKLTYQDAKAKYDAWKKKKDEIRVGDEVIPMDTEYDTMIVTRTWKDDYWRECIDTVGFDGSICSFLQCKVKKTGRHFDDIEELLKKMKGEE